MAVTRPAPQKDNTKLTWYSRALAIDAMYDLPSPFPVRSTCHIEVPRGDLVSWTFARYGQYDTDRPIYVDASNEARSISAAQARLLVQQLVAGFQAHGLVAGDCIIYPILWLGIVAAGGCVAATNPSSTVLELHHHLKTTSAKFIVTENDFLSVVSSVAKENAFPPSHIFVLASAEQSVTTEYVSFATLFSVGAKDWDVFHEEESAEQIAALLSTSGTSGTPKAAALSHKVLLAQMVMIHNEEETKPYKVSQLICLPMFHAFAAMLALIMPLRLGHTTYIMPRFDLQQFLEAVRKFSITETAVVPPIIHTLMKSGVDIGELLKSLRYVRCAGATLSSVTLQEFCRLLGPKIVVAQVWGMTEVGWITAFPWWEQDTSGSVGRVLPSVEIKLMNDLGSPVDNDGAEGEACVRSPSVFSGYLGNVTANENAFDSDGWFKTGDLAYFKEGKCYLRGRIKDIMKIRGFQVSPTEIENIVQAHPQVGDCCVVGISYEPVPSQDELLPRAYVKLMNYLECCLREAFGMDDDVDGNSTLARDASERRLNKLLDDTHSSKPNTPPTEQEISEYVARRVSRYKRLTGGVQFVDKIPRSPAGKLLRPLLPIPKGAGFSIFR